MQGTFYLSRSIFSFHITGFSGKQSIKVSVVHLWSCYFADWGCSDNGGPCRKFFLVRMILRQVWYTHWWPQHSGSPGADRACGQPLCTLWFPGQQWSICGLQQNQEPLVQVSGQRHAAATSGQPPSAASQECRLSSDCPLLLPYPPLFLLALLPTDRTLTWRTRIRAR